jgi:hypothetical protein
MALLAAVAVAGCVNDDLTAVEGLSTDGMTAMTSPIRVPQAVGARDRTEVWLRVPGDARITALWLGDQRRHALRFPTGTIAARVESWDGDIADVRGTQLDEQQQERFFVLRPSSHGLTGVAWVRGRAHAQERATARLAALAPDDRTAGHLARQNDCASCHMHGRAANERPNEHGSLNRATDASGFFGVGTVLEDEAPLENYRPIDPNVDDPYVELRCGDAAAETISRPGERRVRCVNGLVPRARYDFKRALVAGDAHARSVCASRRALFAWTDRAAHDAFAAAFAECGLIPE